MPNIALETDYLIIGAGAMGLAFADELLTQDPNARMIIVGKRAKPGGHWNDAYPFVSLHQPAAYYGVNSMQLGEGGAALASGDEVLAYFSRAMKAFIASGRVQYFPMCIYRGGGRFQSLISPDTNYTVSVRKKTVDATYMSVEVPATRPPAYTFAPEINVVAPNALVNVREPHSKYVVIGAGKTGIDALLFLLDQGVAPRNIRWIVSNDSWLLTRERIQPGRAMDGFAEQVQIFIRATTLGELTTSLEEDGFFTRVDQTVRPTRFRCATVSQPELAQLRSIDNVTRLGRVVRIEADTIVLEEGTLPTDANALHVDCTANGLTKPAIRPVFDGPNITLQSLNMCQQVFSASLIAYLEKRYDNDTEKNALSQVVPHPEFPRDFVAAQLTSLSNFNLWSQKCLGWLKKSRLSAAHHESNTSIARSALVLARTSATIIRQLNLILEQEFPIPAPAAITLSNGSLKFTTHQAGLDTNRGQPLVICLHGFPDNPHSFRHQLPALVQKGYRVLVPTLRGYEPSSQPADDDYSLSALGRDVIAWMDGLREEKVHLIGHDWGGSVACAAGSIAPERFYTLTTIAAPHSARFMEGMRKVPAQVRKSWYMNFFQLRGVAEFVLEQDDWALIRKLRKDWSPDYDLSHEEWRQLRSTFASPGVKKAMLAYYRENASISVAFGLKTSEDLSRVAVPTLAIAGVDDGCIDVRMFDHTFPVTDFPEGVRVERIQSAGHFVHQEKPEQVNQLLAAWLGSMT